jgi:hypothetical protein
MTAAAPTGLFVTICVFKRPHRRSEPLLTAACLRLGRWRSLKGDAIDNAAHPDHDRSKVAAVQPLSRECLDQRRFGTAAPVPKRR